MSIEAQPRLVGDGPPTASTCLDLDLLLIHDVNGYYRDLGVDSRATRGQISRAYKERGADDAHLTFVVQQLLNPMVRREYDLTPQGHVFLDREVLTRIRHAHARRVSVARSTVSSRSIDLEYSNFLRVIDKSSLSVQDASQTSGWPYSHYVWGVSDPDAARLKRWQESLTVALGRAGVRMQIAVGVMGGDKPEVQVLQVGSRMAVFIHENCRSTDALVARAVSLLIPSTLPNPGDRKMSDNLPLFRRGTAEAQEASKGASFAKTHYFSLSPNSDSPDNTAILRFITDWTESIVVDQHSNIPTKPAPKDYDGTSWPRTMGAVCRQDKALRSMFSDCFICDHIVNGKTIKGATGRSWAWAVLREEVIEDGQVVGIRDKTREVAKVDDKGKPTGEVYTEKAIVVVNMGYKNFFGLLEGFGKRLGKRPGDAEGTLLDRDYFIRRSGSGTDTTYSIVNLDPIVVDEAGTVFDLRNPQFADRYQPPESLESLVLSRASDEFYARFFDTRVEAPASRKGSDAADVDAPSRPTAEVSSDRMAALADRVKGYGAASPSAAEPAPAAAAAKPAAKTGGMRNFDS